MTEVLYNTVAWNEEQVGALVTAADGLAEIERRQDGEVVVKTTDFPTLFERMTRILSETSACKKVIISEPVQVQLPKNNRTFEDGVIRQTLVRVGILKPQT